MDYRRGEDIPEGAVVGGYLSVRGGSDCPLSVAPFTNMV